MQKFVRGGWIAISNKNWLAMTVVEERVSQVGGVGLLLRNCEYMLSRHVNKAVLKAY